MYTSLMFESEAAMFNLSKMTSEASQGRWVVVQNVEWTSFAKEFAAAQTLHPVTGVSNKPACWKQIETNYPTINSV